MEPNTKIIDKLNTAQSISILSSARNNFPADVDMKQKIDDKIKQLLETL
jgi:hypothetical protein